MQYNVREGAHSTWYERFGSVPQQITAHNWLPAAAAGVVIFWVGLLFAALNQTGPVNPGRPSDLTAAKTNPPMLVTATSGGSMNTGGDASSSSRAAPAVPAAAAATGIGTVTPVAEAPIIPAIDVVVGGRGGDASPAAPSAPIAPAVPSVNAGAAMGGAPLTAAPVTVQAGVTGGSSSTQTGLNLDGIL